MKIEGSTFLISGGGSGLGAATARRIASENGNVVIADLNAEAGEAVASELGERGHFVQTNVTDADQVAAAVQAAYDRFEDLDGGISCAGIGTAIKTVGKGAAPHPMDAFERVLRVNLFGTFNVIRLVAAAISEHKGDPDGSDRGILINTASIAAYEGQIGQAAYSASKGGIVGMTLPIARDLARGGIRCVTIAPGLFDTPLLAGLPEPARKSLEAGIPFPSRLGRPEEYAHLAVSIIENEMLNGEVIRLDGALRMAPR